MPSGFSINHSSWWATISPQILAVSRADRSLLRTDETEDSFQLDSIGRNPTLVKPGRYILTLVVTDPYADKKYRTVSRSIDFFVTN